MEVELGSVWRKWDLHLHTPASFDYKSKDVTFTQLADVLNKSDVDCFAVTDHWTLDGYKSLSPLISSEKLILPGIELRIDTISRQKGQDGSGVMQCLVIFPQDIESEEIEMKFLHQIKLCGTKDKFITKKELIELGKKHASGKEYSDARFYELGCEQAYVSFNDVVEKAAVLGALVCLTYDKHGGFEGIDPIKDSELKRNLVKASDMIEVAKESVRDSFLEHPEIVKLCEKQTPCFMGSDAHSLHEIGSRSIWIKAERSFQGLKQVKYFPKERISFSSSKPSYSYPRIKSISLSNHQEGHALSKLSEVITFSDNLTAIIGHPSIGKSTLVETLSYIFDKHTNVEIGEAETKIEFITSKNPSMTVTARILNGNVESTIRRPFDGAPDGDIASDEISFTYLNQGFIDRTARNPSAVSDLIVEKMEHPELESNWELIESTKKKIVAARDAHLQKFVQSEKKQEVEAKLAKVIRFFDISSSVEYVTLSMRSKGLEDKEKSFTSVERDLTSVYETLLEYEGVIKDNLPKPEKIKELFPSLASQISPIQPPALSSAVKEQLELVKKSSEKKEMEEAKTKVTSDIHQLLDSEGIRISEDRIKQQKENKRVLEEELKTVDEELENYEAEMEKHQQLALTMKGLYQKWLETDSDAVEAFNEGLKAVSIKYEPADILVWLLQILTSEVKDAWDKYTPDNQKSDRFMKPREEDIKKLLARIISEKDITPDELPDFLINSIEKNEIPIAEEHEHLKWIFTGKSDVIRQFLLMRLKEFAENGKHQVFYNGKNISKEGLSFTERCGALLEILLEKGNEPIVIDQPEENLGSQYIIDTLIPKLLSKKAERQVIIVSHNPNTVVLADADLIISLDNNNATDSLRVESGAIESSSMRSIICDIMEGGEQAFALRAKRYERL